ncbi:hypothetical protein [Brevibacterium sp. 1718]|uniref:hypothetical protein n=1 Tax=Brevibacterium sp. 1718 TaxID=3413510 RepID=UPI003DA7F201
MMITTNSVARLAQRCGEFLGDFGQTMTTSYPASLALCILDAIYSTGSHPTAVDKVVARYIAQHGEAHGAKSLRYSIAAAGGARPWAEFEACNLKPASTRPGAVLKAEVVDDATRVMADYGIDDVGDLLEAVGEGVGNDAFSNDVSKAWRALPSQSSGITWLHLLMLAGCPQFEVDDKVVGYLAEVADPEADLTVDYVHDEIHAVARVLDTEVSAVRRIVWQASHGRILSLLKDEDLLPADGPIEGPETSSSVWEFSPEPVAGRPF